MATTGVVEAIDVFEECVSHVLACLPFLPPDELCFQCFEESFDCGIIITISFPAHGCFEAKLTKPLLIVMRAVLASAVRVMHTSC